MKNIKQKFINFLKRNFYNKCFLWIIVFSTSGYAIIVIFLLVLERFQTDSTSLTLSTTYIRWSNTFPAISICLIRNAMVPEFTEAMKRRDTTNRSENPTYVKTIYEYLFLIPENTNIRQETCKGLNSSCGVDILDLRREILATSCKTFMLELYFSNRLYENCEDIFKFHQLEIGYCFLANNLNDYKSNEHLPLKFSSTEKNPRMKIILQKGLIYKYQLYIHSPEDVPYFNGESFMISPQPTNYSFNMEELHNDVAVIHENVKHRMCKFPQERISPEFVYSFSSCMTQIRNDMEIKLCNCTLSPTITGIKYCDIKEMKCLRNENISKKVKEYVSNNMVCLPSCTEQQISLVASIERNVDISEHEVEINIANVPTTRYYRIVTQSNLDIIVAIGGVIGLFIGASLLNILEVIIYLLKYIKNIIYNCYQSMQESDKLTTPDRKSSIEDASPVSITSPTELTKDEIKSQSQAKLSQTSIGKLDEPFREDAAQIDNGCNCCHCCAVRHATKQAAWLQTPEGKLQLEMRMHLKNFLMDISAFANIRHKIRHQLDDSKESLPAIRNGYPLSITKVTRIDKNCLSVNWFNCAFEYVDHYEIYVDNKMIKRVFNPKLTTTILLDVNASRPHRIAMKGVPKIYSNCNLKPLDLLIHNVCIGIIENVPKNRYDFSEVQNQPNLKTIDKEYIVSKYQTFIDLWEPSVYLYTPVCNCSVDCDCDNFD